MILSSEWQDAARRLATELRDAGVLTDQAWWDAFAATPRHVFVPSFIDGDHVVGAGSDEDRWLEAVYSDEAMLTQTRTHTDGELLAQELPTSSSSAPSVMAVMLDRLAVQPGSSVLEIGTGTGYNAALLCHRLGEASVASIDIDPALVTLARRRLNDAGHRPAMIAKDGTTGWAQRAPYDRIIATCAVTHVPPEWIGQLAEGGRIVAPLVGPGGGLMVLDKTAPDEVSGGFDLHSVGFMPLRDQVAEALPSGETMSFAGTGLPHCGLTRLDPREIAGASEDQLLFLLLHLPGLDVAGARDQDIDSSSLVVYTGDAMAEVDLTPTTDHGWAVQQRGAYRLWDTVEHAARAWTELGQPGRSRLGITALDRVDRQYVWLDSPESSYSWPLHP